MNTELNRLIEGYAELNTCYGEREVELHALNRAINKAAHTPIFPFNLSLLTDVVKAIKKLEGDFPDTKAFLKNPSVAIREMAIDFDLALPGHSQLKIGYNQIESLMDNIAYEKIKLWDPHAKHDSKTLNESIDQAEAECALLNASLSELKKAFPLTAMAFDGKTELGAFDQHFDLILSGYSELKAAYATQVVLLEQYNDARKAVITHPEFNFNLHRLGELDQEIEKLETRYPKALAYHQKLEAEERMQILDLSTDPDPEPPVYFPLDAHYLFS